MHAGLDAIAAHRMRLCVCQLESSVYVQDPKQLAKTYLCCCRLKCTGIYMITSSAAAVNINSCNDTPIHLQTILIVKCKMANYQNLYICHTSLFDTMTTTLHKPAAPFTRPWHSTLYASHYFYGTTAAVDVRARYSRTVPVSVTACRALPSSRGDVAAYPPTSWRVQVQRPCAIAVALLAT